MKVPLQKGRDLSPDDEYRVTFKIMEKELTVGLAVRKMDKRGDYADFLGMEFTDIPPRDREALMIFLDFQKKHTPG